MFALETLEVRWYVQISWLIVKSMNDHVPLSLQAIAALMRCEEEGRPRAEIFMELPSRHELPAYYDIVKKVIVLSAFHSSPLI